MERDDPDDALCLEPASELVRLLRGRELASRELLDSYVSRIERLDPLLNAVVTLDVERARAAAAAADEAAARGGPLGPLHGLPVTVKDSIETAGLRTTAGAEELAGHVPAGDAPAVARLRAAGAIVFGKTNLPAWASDAQTFNTLFGTTRNPWDLARTPGGSSGGAAAAVAAGLTGLELGSDIGGSLRIPAHFCGVYTLKPSYGIVPLRGHLPPAPGALAELDVAPLGPLARGPRDLALWLSVVAGPDRDRAAAWRLELPAPAARSLREYRIACWLDDPYCSVDAAVLGALRDCADALRSAGAQVEVAPPPVPLPEGHAVARRIIQPALSHGIPEAEFARLRQQAEEAAPEDRSEPVRWARHVTQRVRDLNVAVEQRAQFAARWAEFFARYDVLLTPVTPSAAFPHDHGEPRAPIEVNGAPRAYGDQFAWVQSVGVVHLPAAVAPAGLTPGGLPVGVQVVGPYLGDRTVVDVVTRMAEVAGGFRAPVLDSSQASAGP